MSEPAVAVILIGDARTHAIEPDVERPPLTVCGLAWENKVPIDGTPITCWACLDGLVPDGRHSPMKENSSA